MRGEGGVVEGGTLEPVYIYVQNSKHSHVVYV